MFYAAEILCFKSKGKFSRCWLAATNFDDFKKFVKRSELEQIIIANLW